MTFISKTAIALALGLSAVAAQAAPVNLVSNPGFDTRDGKDSKAASWSGEYRSSSAKRTGDAGARLDDEDFEDISQTITGLTSGSHYTLSFWLKWTGDEDGGEFKYDFGSFKDNKLKFSDDQEEDGFDWQQLSKDFTANSTSMLLKFRGKAEEDGKWYIDDVSLVAKNGNVPLPATLPLMGLGLLGLGLARRARRAA